uniref:Uncharacterized protein n=1 Tax=Medicago truncatula TaxID=3880 RepID=I3SVW3_MEDTR|nr:unknown [Medicago truncatula]
MIKQRSAKCRYFLMLTKIMMSNMNIHFPWYHVIYLALLLSSIFRISISSRLIKRLYRMTLL